MTTEEFTTEGGMAALKTERAARRELKKELADYKAEVEADQSLNGPRLLRHEIADLKQQVEIMTLERDMWTNRCKVNGEKLRRLRLELEDAHNA